MSTFYHLFCECAERWPEIIALEIQRRDRVERSTYSELRNMADAIGRWLTDRGHSPGQRIAILAENHPRWVAAYLGIIAAGCAAVPLDTAFHVEQVETLLKDSGSSLLFCDIKHRGIGEAVTRSLSLPLVLIDGPAATSSAASADLDGILAAGPGKLSSAARDPADLASLLYTSGTTADPKGVILTHANMLGEIQAVFSWVDIGPNDAILGVLPLFHVLSQMANLLLPLVMGARVVYLETLNTTELLRALSEREITAFAVVPQFFYLIHERIFKEIAARGALATKLVRVLMATTRASRRLGFNPGRLFFGKIHRLFGPRMRFLVTGGSRFDPEIARDFAALGIDVLQAYGLTETTGAACANHPGNNVIGSVGPPLPGVSARIVEAQPNEEGGPPVGEIALRGAIVMKGYWQRPEATATVLKDGWLYTGDLGYLDPQGNVFITGRKKEVIVLSNGKNIYPEEIETHYLKSPFIKEICVLGLEGRPGDPASDRLHAVVVPNLEVLRQRQIVNAKEVIRFDIESLSADLPSTKRVGGYEIWQSDLPRTTTRKLKRFEIEKRVRSSHARGSSGEDIASDKPLTDQDQAWLEQPEVRRALTVIRANVRARTGQIRPGHSLELDLGLDSMQRIELLVALEQELGGDLGESQLACIYTVRELVDAVLAASDGSTAPAAKQFAGWSVVLREDPPAEEVIDLIRPRRAEEGFWFTLSRLVQLVARDRFHLRVSGLEKLPAFGPFILSSNHQSFLDPAILAGLLPGPVFRNTFAVGTSEIFGSGFMRRLARWLRVVVVDPDANLVPAMRAASFGLRHGRILILYPEGERSIDGLPKTFKKGAAILSIHLQVPIVPIAIEGFHEAWPRGKGFQKFTPLQVLFGDPIFPPPESDASEDAYLALTEKVRSRIVAMWEQLRKRKERSP